MGCSQAESLVRVNGAMCLCDQVRIGMRTVWREEKRPARIKRLPGSRNAKTGNRPGGKVMRVNDNSDVGFSRPKGARNSPHKFKLAVEISSLAIRTIANGIVGGLDHQPIRIRIEIEEHLAGIIEHKLLRFRLCRAKVVPP